MDVLGHEIDPAFIYKVSPIESLYKQRDYYCHAFKLDFKDGRSHEVKLKYNMSEMPYRNSVLVGKLYTTSHTPFKK